MLVVLIYDAGQNVFWSSMNYTAFGAGKKDFNSKHLTLNVKISAKKPSQGFLNASAVSLNQSSARPIANMPLKNRNCSPYDILMSCLTREAISEKGRHSLLLISLRQANSFAI